MDTPAPVVAPSTGFASSEGKLTAIAMVVGFLLESVAVPLLDKFSTSNPGAVWASVALMACGALIQVAALFGYQRARTALKLGAPKP